MKRVGFAASLIGVAAFFAIATSIAMASTTPRWVKHVHRYPGGISNGVRAYLDPGLRKAKQQAQASQSLSSPAAPAAPGPLQNEQVNSDDSNPPLPQNETQVAHSELDDNVAVAGANDYVGGVQIYATADGGQTWTTHSRVPTTGETRDFCTGGDPTVAYSLRDHAFYFAQVCFDRAFPVSEIQVIQSTDNGQTWTGGDRTPSTAISNFRPQLQDFNPALFYDKPQITVDNNPSSPHFGRIYVTYVKFHIEPDGFSDYCPVNVSFTNDIDPNNDGDLTDAVWHHRSVVPDNPGGNGVGPSANQGAQPVVDNQGGLDISYMTEGCNRFIDHGIFMRRSTDGGQTFGAAKRINKANQWADNPNPDDLLPNKKARFPASTSAPLVFNPVDNSLNYIVQNNINRKTTGADISFTKSKDYGQTWSKMSPVAVNAAGNPALKDQFFPWMDVDAQGNLHAIWYDNRNAPKNTRIETFQGSAGIGGQHWTNTDISTKSWNPNSSFFSSGSFVGDYNGFAVGDSGVMYPIWTDGRDTPGAPLGQTDVWTNVEFPTP